jgi:hypothetical protein
MYDFIKNMWIMGRYNSTNVDNCVTKGYITQDQANMIMTSLQMQIIINSTNTAAS